MRTVLSLVWLVWAAPAVAQTTIAPPTTDYRLAFSAAPTAAQVTRNEVRASATAAWQSIGTATTVTLPVLTDGAYTYAVRHCNATGCGPDTSVAFTVASPPPQLALPPAPADVRIEKISSGGPPPTQGLGVIVRMNCQGGAAWPNCGANRTVGNDTVADRNPAVVKWERTYIANEDAAEIHMLATGNVEGDEGYYGWQWTGLSAPAAGARRVFRARIKVMSPINWGVWGDKFYIFGDAGGDASQRVIGTMKLWQGQPNLNVDKNINGHYAGVNLRPDVYEAVQMVVEPTTPGGTNYNFKYYLNGTLVSTSVSFTINAARWTDFSLGYYGQYANGGHVRVRFKDVEFADTYDPAFGAPLKKK